MKALQKDMKWVEKQFFLVACKKLAAEKKKVDDLHRKLKEEITALQKLDNKIHGAVTRKALTRVHQELQTEVQKVRRQLTSLSAHEHQLKRHFTHDKQQLMRKERERLALVRRGILVI